MAKISTRQFVTTTEGDIAFVRRLDEKSQRAVLVFIEGEASGAEAMRRLTTLTQLKHRNGRVQQVRNLKEAVQAARAGTLVSA